MNQREAVKVLRQLAKDAERMIPFIMDSKCISHAGDIINILVSVDYMRHMKVDDQWRVRMFDEYYALYLACAKFKRLSGLSSLELDTFRRATSRGKYPQWPIFFIKNCISILHEGQIYH